MKAPAWTLPIASMFSVQLGSALSVGLIGVVGAAGTAWLRLTAGTLMFWLIARPPLRSVHRKDLPVLVGLGVATGLTTIALLAALDRIPLGTAVAIEFLGPLTVAAVRSQTRRMLAWPALALAGVLLMTQPWKGEINASGVAFAALAAVGWGTYIILMQRLGERFAGLSGLSLTMPIAAFVAAVFGIPEAAGHLSWSVALTAVWLAVLLPVLPYALELVALRRMNAHAFGTLMSLEPAFALLLGMVVLGQMPVASQVLGIAMVVIAGAGAQQVRAPDADLEVVSASETDAGTLTRTDQD